MSTQLQTKAKALFDKQGYQNLTPIQEQVYSHASKRKDLMAQSATGTGKTHAFLLPLMDRLDGQSNQCQAVIISPTRELARQTYQFALAMRDIEEGLRIELVSGGSDRLRMKSKLSEKQPHLVIGTPGRIKDMFLDGDLRVDQADTIIIDEADMIYEFGFLEDVDVIFNRVNKKVHTMVFSATIVDQLKPFIKQYLHHPLTINTQDDSPQNPDVKHILIEQKHKSYPEALLDLLAVIEPAGCIIFANTRTHASEVAEMMREHGISVLELHGDLTARQRQQTLSRLQDNELVYLVATDIAARGLDLPHVSHVISLGFPSQIEFYIHRSGRTGRAGKSGYAYVIVNEKDKKTIERVSNMGISFEYQSIRNKQLTTVRNFYHRAKRLPKADPDITRILNRKTDKVKPNHKKKKALEIDKLQRKKRRDMIRKDIAEQKKARAKAKAQAKD